MTCKRLLITGLTFSVLLNVFLLIHQIVDMKGDDKEQMLLRDDLRQVSLILSAMQSGNGKESGLLSRVKLSTSNLEKLEEFEIVEIKVHPTKETSFFIVATKRNGKALRESIQLIEGKVAGWVSRE